MPIFLKYNTARHLWGRLTMRNGFRNAGRRSSVVGRNKRVLLAIQLMISIRPLHRQRKRVHRTRQTRVVPAYIVWFLASIIKDHSVSGRVTVYPPKSRPSSTHIKCPCCWSVNKTRQLTIHLVCVTKYSERRVEYSRFLFLVWMRLVVIIKPRRQESIVLANFNPPDSSRRCASSWWLRLTCIFLAITDWAAPNHRPSASPRSMSETQWPKLLMLPERIKRGKLLDCSSSSRTSKLAQTDAHELYAPSCRPSKGISLQNFSSHGKSLCSTLFYTNNTLLKRFNFSSSITRPSFEIGIQRDPVLVRGKKFGQKENGWSRR